VVAVEEEEEEEGDTRGLRAICPPTRNLHHNRRGRDSSHQVPTTTVLAAAAAAVEVAVIGIATNALATLVVVNGAFLHPTEMTAMIETTLPHLAVTTGTATTATAIVVTAAIAIATSIGIRIAAAKRSLGGDIRRVRMRRPGRGRGGIPVVRAGAVAATKCRVGSIRAMRMIITPGEDGRLGESVRCVGCLCFCQDGWVWILAWWCMNWDVLF